MLVKGFKEVMSQNVRTVCTRIQSLRKIRSNVEIHCLITKYSINLAKNVKIVWAPENSSIPG